MPLTITDNPCSCGTPWRDYDNRCLRCKKSIENSRAEQLPYSRKISEIGDCKCTEKSKNSWGTRDTTVENLFLCNFCDLKLPGRIEDLEETKAQEELIRQVNSRKKRLENIEAEVVRIIREAKSGKRLYLYRSHYVSIDSYNNFGGEIATFAPFDDIEVRIAGTNGWRAIEALPRTSGDTLQNYEGFGKAWAGGIGGSVVGAYVLMEYEINQENVEASEDLIRFTVSSYTQE